MTDEPTRQLSVGDDVIVTLPKRKRATGVVTEVSEDRYRVRVQGVRRWFDVCLLKKVPPRSQLSSWKD